MKPAIDFPTSSTPEQDFSSLTLTRTPQDDAELAELIERDGRSRLDRGLPCGIDRYRKAVPDLNARPISLDAAIDISLRSLARLDGSPVPTAYHAECLLKSYPDLAGPIRLAALLSSQVGATSGISPRSRARSLDLPCHLGPDIGQGRRRYELVRVLGEGSSGMVCEAIDHLLSDAGFPAKVAVKLIPVSESTIQRQASEATKARRIDHAGVVRVLDRGLTDDDQLFLVYELVAGGDLQSWFDSRTGEIPLRTVALLVADIAEGVQAAHDMGLIHCDLKPSNVLVTPDGRPRVSDFGVAVVPADAGAAPGRMPIGNLAFAAPEQILGAAALATPAVDVYALGGLLYYLATGVLPNGRTPEEVSRTHDPVEGRSSAPPISAHRKDADTRFTLIAARAMHPRSESRYSSAGDLARDLRAWLHDRALPSFSEPLTTRSRLWIRRNPRYAALTAACLVLLVGGGSAAAYLSHKSNQKDARLKGGLESLKDAIKGIEETRRRQDMSKAEKADRVTAIMKAVAEGMATQKPLPAAPSSGPGPQTPPPAPPSTPAPTK